jgi:arylsulfate sulfotransferase
MSFNYLKILSLAVTLAVLTGCGSSSDQNLPTLSFLEQPSVSDITAAPLAKRLITATNLNANFIAVLEDNLGDSYQIGFVTRRVSNTGRVDYDLTVLGLKPDRTYTMTVTAVTDDGISTMAQSPVTFSTDPLPADFPTITLLAADPARMEPTYTLMDTRRKDGSAAYMVIIDPAGEVVWYYKPAGTSATHLALSDGSVMPAGLLTMDETIGLIHEIDMRGETLTRTDPDEFGAEIPFSFYSAQSQPSPPESGSLPVDTAEFHADVTLSNSTRTYFTTVVDDSRDVAGYPTDECDAAATGTVRVQDEPVLEFDLNGTIISQINLLDVLKQTRIGFDGTTVLPGGGVDWVHTDSVILDTRNNAIIASLRNQDAVISISRSTNELLWILGNSDNWAGFEQFLLTPVGDFEWPYHQHALQITSAGTLMLFDNGNRRASPFDCSLIVPADANFSRAVEYSLNLTDRTISQDWDWGETESLYATTAGNANLLPLTGNRLITFGALCEIGGVPSDDLDNCRTTARVIEVERETDEKVFDVLIDGTTDVGYMVWSSERLPTLYIDSNASLSPIE